MPIVVLVASLSSSIVSAQQPSAAGTFRNDSEHTGVFADASSGLYGGVLWQTQTRGAIRSTPVVAGHTLLAGSSDGNLYALDSGTGVEQWRFAAGSAVASSVAVSDGRVFFSDFGGTFYAVDFVHGTLLWKMHFGPDLPLAWVTESGPHPDRFWGDFILSSATVATDTVVVGGGDGAVYALDVSSGRTRWKFQTDGRVRSSPAISNHTVYVGSFDGSVYALDLASGKQVWKYDTEGRPLNSATFGFDRRSILSSPAVADGTVFIGSRDGHLYALDASKGTAKWNYSHRGSWAISSPAVLKSAVYEGSSDGHFFNAVSTTDGHEIWRFLSDSVMWSSPALAGSTAYIGDGQGNLFAIDLASGQERWRYVATAGIVSSPAIANGVLYFGSNDGRIYALRINAESSLKRAVFWDAESQRMVFSFSPSYTELQGTQLAARDFFSGRGYDVLGASQVEIWLKDRIAGHEPSVVVFANDWLPAAIVGSDPSQGLLHKYLESGGKVVWMNGPPLMTADNILERSWDKTDKLLGISHIGALADEDAFHDMHALPAGLAWGLEEWWLSPWDVPISEDMTVLATDERGSSGAWIKQFGGDPGTGFLFVSRATWNNDGFERLAIMAECRPKSPTERNKG